MAEERWSGGSIESPASRAEAVTPSDSTDITRNSRGIYVGGAGNLAVTMVGGGNVTFVGVAAGTILPIRVSRVLSTSTTATSIVALD